MKAAMSILDLCPPTRPKPALLLARLATCCAISCVGCGGEDTVVIDAAEVPRAPGVPAPPEATSSAPVYAISTNVFSPEGITGYLAVVPSLDASTEMDLGQAIEFPGGANAVGFDGDTSVYVGLWSSPIVERWDLQADGTFARGPVVSFAHLGVATADPVAFTDLASRTKSYFTDDTGRQLVIWNPEQMTALGTVLLPLENEGALVPRLMNYLTIRQGNVLVNSFMNDPDDWTKYSDRSRLLSVDTTTDTVTGVDEWVGCEKVQLAGQTSDGTAYYTADNARTFARYALGPNFGAAACSLRVIPPGAEFDEGYDVDLTSLVGGRPVAGDLVIVSDRMAFVRVWHDEDSDRVVTPENFSDVYSSVRAFRYWSWELGSAQAHLIENQTPQASYGDKFQVDGRTFVVDYSLLASDAAGDAPLTELLPSGELRPALVAKGQVGGKIVRLR